MIGPYLIACVLLVVAGASKAARPTNTVRGLGQAFAYPRLLVVAVPLVAVAEMILGGSAIIWPIPVLAALVAGSYAIFAAFVVTIRLRHGAISSCGCFGTPDTPATLLHAVVNLFLAASGAVVAAAEPGRTIVAVLKSQPVHGVPLALAVAVGVYLVIIAFSSLAQLTAIRHAMGGLAERSSS